MFGKSSKRGLTICFLLILMMLVQAPQNVSAALTDGLISYWPLDDGSGAMCTDVFGSHNGTATGGISWVPGKIGGAFDTNDSGYFTIPQHADLRPANQVSVQCWVFLYSYGNWDSIVSNCWDTGSMESGYEIFMSGNMGLRCGVAGVLRLATGAITTGQWVHYVGTYDGTTVKTYKDGQLLASNSDAGGPIDWDPVPYDLYIGRFHDDNENNIADAVIDEVAIWNRALSSADVTELYNGGAGKPAAGGGYVVCTETGGSTAVTEGGTNDTYDLKLGTQPDQDVLITAVPADAQIDLGAGAGAAVTLTFTSTNWDTAQTVTVTAVDDDVYEGKTPHTTDIDHTTQSLDDNYNDIVVASVAVSVTDNEEICGDWGYNPRDLNHDCYVNLLDFAEFARYWLESISQ